MDSRITRRVFAGAAAAVCTGNILGANDRIRVGMVGTGGRGSSHIGAVYKVQDLNVTISAVCDIWKPNLERAAATVQESFGEAPKKTVDYQEMLSWDDVDAVIIATPDFWHCPILIDAVKAGKDAYVEKPFGNVFWEVKEAYRVVKASDRIVQVGTQFRSEPHLVTASRMIEQGILGKISRAETAFNVSNPRWARDYSDVKAEDISWDLYRRPGIPAETDIRLLRQWQLFRGATNGIAGLWMSHLVDVYHWFTGNAYPRSAVTQGGAYYWKDGRETADIFYTLLDYPDDSVFLWTMNQNNSAGRREVYYGDKGILDVGELRVGVPDGGAYFSGEGSGRDDKIKERIDLEPAEINSHMANFIECIRSRQQPRADVQAGFSHAVASIMTSTALDEKRLVSFDAERLEII
jgi:predicted dehydrogenase